MVFRKKVHRKHYSFQRRAGHRSSGSGGSIGLLGHALVGFGYGTAREPLMGLLKPLVDMLPLGEYNDEAVGGALGFVAAKGWLGNNKYIKAAGQDMIVIETYRVGAKMNLLGGMIGSSGSAPALASY